MSMGCCDFRISENRQCGSYAFNLWQEGIKQKYCDRHHWQSEAGRLRAEVEALRAENHNLNWALGTPGYNAMATPEDQAEHEAAVARTDAILARMEKAKAERAAMTADADRYRFMDEHCGLVDMVSDPDNLVQVWVAERRYYGDTLDAAIDAARAAQGDK